MTTTITKENDEEKSSGFWSYFPSLFRGKGQAKARQEKPPDDVAADNSDESQSALLGVKVYAFN